MKLIEARYSYTELDGALRTLVYVISYPNRIQINETLIEHKVITHLSQRTFYH